MFENLTTRLSETLRHVTGKSKLTEQNVHETLKEVRKALLDADVAIDVVKQFLESIKTKALGQKVDAHLSPGQFFVKLVKDELIHLMGVQNENLNLKKPQAVILLAGLQGSGKTTTSAKLAKFIKEVLGKKVMLASCDVYRPAAIEQLQILADQIEVPCFATPANADSVTIATDALKAAKQLMVDVLIVDTAGRLHIDDTMMEEIKNLHQVLTPAETLFVVDSMTGQDAANSAKAFHNALALTGVILTKADGDARGGAALSIRHITGKPIKFIGVSEKLEGLEPFHPDRIASRILGMGDVLTLIDELERKVDKKKAEKLAKKISKGKGFDLEDLKEQLLQMSNMGGLTGMLDKLPGMSAIPQAAKDKLDNGQFNQMIAIINSMTLQERRHPALVMNKGSRKRRIAEGSGTQIQDVNRVLKHHQKMQKMMKKVSSKSGMIKMMQGLQDKLPPGMFGI